MAFKQAAIATLLVTFVFMATQCSEAKDISCEQFELWNVPHFRCAHNRTNSLGELESQCIVDYWVCDSIIDCHDASDERIINATTKLNECQQYWEEQCISDYKDKKTSDGNDLQKFQCANGQCILGCLRCNEKRDCVDGSESDEPRDCSPNEVIPPCN